jgi:geranylgeranyl pyrophosphate synthase
LKNVSKADFENIVAKKSCAAMVSLAAIAARYQRSDAFGAWAEFWYAFGCWNQMLDDLLDWQKDVKNGIDTYLVSEARRRKEADEEIAHWLIREGFEWAGDRLEAFGSKARDCAAQLGSPELEAYVETRVTDVSVQVYSLRKAFAAVDAAIRAR